MKVSEINLVGGFVLILLYRGSFVLFLLIYLDVVKNGWKRWAGKGLSRSGQLSFFSAGLNFCWGSLRSFVVLFPAIFFRISLEIL